MQRLHLRALRGAWLRYRPVASMQQLMKCTALDGSAGIQRHLEQHVAELTYGQPIMGWLMQDSEQVSICHSDTLLPKTQATRTCTYLHNGVQFQKGVFYQGSLCPSLVVAKPKLPILVVAPGVHRTWTSPDDSL